MGRGDGRGSSEMPSRDLVSCISTCLVSFGGESIPPMDVARRSSGGGGSDFVNLLCFLASSKIEN